MDDLCLFQASALIKKVALKGDDNHTQIYLKKWLAYKDSNIAYKNSFCGVQIVKSRFSKDVGQRELSVPP